MEAVTVSPKFQVVIPRSVREHFKIQVGQKLQMIPRGNHIVLVPVEPIREARGSLRGMDTTIDREEEDRV